MWLLALIALDVACTDCSRCGLHACATVLTALLLHAQQCLPKRRCWALYAAEYWAIICDCPVVESENPAVGAGDVAKEAKKYENGKRSDAKLHFQQRHLPSPRGPGQSISELIGICQWSSGCFEESGGATAVADA